MAKSLGIIRLSGNIEGLSFYEFRGQIIVRRPGGFNGAKIKTHPKYKRVRELNQEFTEASAANRYFRTALHPFHKKLGIPYFHSRIQQLMLQLIAMDTTQEKGLRRVSNALHTDAGWHQLLSFEFDPDRRFSTLFPFATHWNSELGQLTISNFQPDTLPAPQGATHLGIQVLHLGLDWTLVSPPTREETPLQFYALQSEMQFNWVEIPVPPVESSSNLVVLCVGFYLEVQDSLLPMADYAMHLVGGRRIS